jgi:hypothetical protein
MRRTLSGCMREQRFRVDKSDLDPFGARNQARSAALRGAGPQPKNARGRSANVRDEGDSFVVVVVDERPSAGPGSRRPEEPPGLSGEPGREPPGRNAFTKDREPSTSAETLSLEPRGSGLKPASVVRSNMSVGEMRETARRHGFSLPYNATERELSEELVEEGYGVGLTGRW